MQNTFGIIRKINCIMLLLKMFIRGFYPTQLFGELFIFRRFKYKNNNLKVIGLTRIRNEELIINDTLRHMEKHVDGVIIFDDNSYDKTIHEVSKNKNVMEIIINKKWKKDRIVEETANRDVLLKSSKKYNPVYLFYFDADERFEGKIKEFLYKNLNSEFDSIKIRLFDAYITENDKNPVTNMTSLYNFRKYFGPEYRDIIMIWKNLDHICFEGTDAREPVGYNSYLQKFRCQHYGKSLSIEQWEETCEYYYQNFPEPYKTKWKSRKGKAIHEASDFGRNLLEWTELTGENILRLEG